MAPKDDPLWDEFLVVLKRSGLTLPPERLPVLFACYGQVRNWSDLIRAWRNPPSAEPANTYSVASIVRAKEPRP
jgi:hypothetical protein